MAFVECYHPELVPQLAPIVSPMVALGRALRRLHGEDLKIVFIGPCIAKKREVRSLRGEGAVDEAITFLELREMFDSHGITPATAGTADFDSPRAAWARCSPSAEGRSRRRASAKTC